MTHWADVMTLRIIVRHVHNNGAMQKITVVRQEQHVAESTVAVMTSLFVQMREMDSVVRQMLRQLLQR